MEKAARALGGYKMRRKVAGELRRRASEVEERGEGSKARYGWKVGERERWGGGRVEGRKLAG